MYAFLIFGMKAAGPPVSSDGLLRAMRAGDRHIRAWSDVGEQARDAALVDALGGALSGGEPDAAAPTA